jgi:hypothetical protein
MVLLREGDWPGQPEKYRTYVADGWITAYRSSYTGTEYRSPSNNYQAKYVTAGDIAAEIDARIALCGIMGNIVDRLCIEFDEPGQVAIDNRMTDDHMADELRAMIVYISGWQRKSCTYQVWRLLRAITRST